MDAVTREFTHLLTSQLESQRAWFEDLRAQDAAQHSARIAELDAAGARQEHELASLQQRCDSTCLLHLNRLEVPVFRCQRRPSARSRAVCAERGRAAQTGGATACMASSSDATTLAASATASPSSTFAQQLAAHGPCSWMR